MSVPKAAFLPKYSSFSFELKKTLYSAQESILVIYIVFSMLPGISLLLHGGIYTRIAVMGVLIYSGLIAALVMRNKFCEQHKKAGFSLQDSTVVHISSRGIRESLSYDIYETALQNGHYYYSAGGLTIGTGRHKLTFHYEPEDSAAWSNVLLCYEKLQSQIRTPLPPFKIKTREPVRIHLDFINKFKEHTLELLLPTLGIFFTNATLKDEISIFGIICFGITFFMEYVFLWMFLDDIEKFCKNFPILKKAMPSGHKLRLGWRYGWYLYYAVVLMIMIRIHLYLIL